MLAFVQSEHRVCPQPRHWTKLWDLLPDKKRDGAGWEPPLPLILAVWHITSDAQKRERLSLHIRWAAEHGALDAVAAFIGSLDPSQWHYEMD